MKQLSLFGLFFSVALMVACQNSSNTVMTESLNVSSCPANGCVNPAASDDQLRITPDLQSIRKTSASSPIMVAGFDITGTCQYSSYLNHTITATITKLNGTAQAPVNVTGILCINGRFLLTVAQSAGVSEVTNQSVNYRVNLVIKGIDSNGNYHPADDYGYGNTATVNLSMQYLAPN